MDPEMIDLYNPHDDGPPAKIWELLRRNAEFQKECKKIEPIRTDFINFVKKPEDIFTYQWKGKEPKIQKISIPNHKYAEYALQWMLPPPPPYDISTDSHKLKTSQGIKRGVKVRLGPELNRSGVNDYIIDCENKLAPLNLKDNWLSTPRGFRRQFEQAWYRRDIAPMEITRKEFLQPFFNPDGESLSPAETDRINCIFNGVFNRDYRLFAIPNYRMQPNDKKKIQEWVTERLNEGPREDRRRHDFGEKKAWQVFVLFDQLNNKGFNREDAFKETCRRIYGEYKEFTNLREIERLYSQINSDHSDYGLIQRIYPDFSKALSNNT